MSKHKQSVEEAQITYDLLREAKDKLEEAYDSAKSHLTKERIGDVMHILNHVYEDHKERNPGVKGRLSDGAYC